jgi:dUTP pyrophosphatase
MNQALPRSSSTPLPIPVRRLPHGQDLPLPAFQTSGAAGMDLRAAIADPRAIKPGEIALIPCGFSMALPEGFEAQVRPRSGLAIKQGVTVVNAPGTIDADYRGEVGVGLINLGKDSFTVTRGMRIAQMVVQALPHVLLVEQASLSETERGEGGFGHTGQDGSEAAAGNANTARAETEMDSEGRGT